MRNNSTSSRTFSFVANSSNTAVSAKPANPANLTIAGAITVNVAVTYSVLSNAPASGQTNISLQATDTGDATKTHSSSFVQTAAQLVNPTVTPPASRTDPPGPYTVNFQVRNNSALSRTFSFVANSSNTAVSAKPANPVNQTIAANTTVNVPVTYSVLSSAAGGAQTNVSLQATDSGDANRTHTASFVQTVSQPLTNPTVTPPANRTDPPGSLSATFQVRNNSSVSRSFSFVANSSNTAVSAKPANPANLTIAAGTTVNVTVSYSVLASAATAAQASISLQATDTGDAARTHTASFVQTATQLVNPTVTPPASRTDPPGTYTVNLQVRNNSALSRTFSFVANSSNTAVSAKPANPANQTIAANTTVNVSVTYSVLSSAAGGAQTNISLQATDSGDANRTHTASFVQTVSQSLANPTVTPPANRTDPPGSLSATFQVRNNSGVSRSFSFVANSSNTAVSLKPANPANQTIAANTTVNVTVSYSVLASAATAAQTSISLQATDTGDAALTHTASFVQTATQLANPNVTAPGNRIDAPGTYTVNFTVLNNSSVSRGFSFVATSSNTAVSAKPANPGNQTIPAGNTVNVSVTYSVLSSAASGAQTSISLQTTDTGDPARTGSAAFVVTVGQPVASPTVTPPPNQTVPAGTEHTVNFTIRNNHTSPRSYWLSAGSHSGTAASLSNMGAPPSNLAPGASATVFVTYWVETTAPVGSATTFWMTAADSQDQSKSHTASFIHTTGGGGGVQVTPKQELRQVGPSSQNTQTFTVQNLGTAATFNLSAVCTGTATCSSLPPSSMQLGDQTSQTVTVGYSVGALNTTGEVRLHATQSGTAITDVGSINVQVVQLSQAAPVLNLVHMNTAAAGEGLAVDRSLCLDFSIGSAAASECGDLRIGHALPSIRTMNRERTPILVYNSQHAQPHPIVSADVTLPSGTTAPQKVVARIFDSQSGEEIVTREWNTWAAGQTRRISIGIPVPSNRGTGVYEYHLDVESWYGSSQPHTTTRRTVRVPIVNRSESPFGAGWWLSGLEQIVTVSPTVHLLVGGDGGIREYQGPEAGPWIAPSLTRADTLRRDGTNGFRRDLPTKVRITYGSTGRQTRTIVRTDTTHFGYDNGRLRTITVPGRQGAAYTFDYTDNGTGGLRLSRVRGPGLGATRNVDLEALGGSGMRVGRIVDPDGNAVQFTYIAQSNRIATRRDRGNQTTTYTYDGGNKVQSSSLPVPGVHTIVHTMTNAESRTLCQSCAIHPDSAYTLYDGPREPSDVLDHTRIWLNRFGAPTRIRDAMGDSTVLTRANPSFPALVTRVRNPNGFVQEAVYNLRGNITESISINPIGTGLNATISYRYENSSCPDMQTRITTQQGVRTDLKHNNTQCRVRLMYMASDSLTRAVRYFYNARGLVDSVTTPIPAGSVRPVERYQHDILGNLFQVTTPVNGTQVLHRDALGRDTLRITQMNSQMSSRVRVLYDALDRDTAVITFGPRMDETGRIPLGTETASVFTQYDPAGRPLRVRRVLSPNPNNLGSLEENWQYDAAGRTMLASSSAGGVDTYTYDRAGNVLIHRPRLCGSSLCESISVYDALNRTISTSIPQRRFAGQQPRFALDPLASDSVTIPGDVLQFTYDATGMRTADNREARIRRSYNPNGQIRTDSTSLRAYDSGSFNSVYGMEYTYDLDGRALTLRYPAGTAPGSAHLVQYRWDNAFGAVDRIQDLQNLVYTYQFDPAGSVKTVSMPGNLTETRTYDQGSRLMSRAGAMRSASYSLDFAGRLAGFTGQGTTFSAGYTGLGAVANARGGTLEVMPPPGGDADSDLYELFSLDPLGNTHYSQTRHRTESTWDDPRRETFNWYTSAGALSQTISGDTVFFYSAPGIRNAIGFRIWNEANYGYDGAGNRTGMTRRTRFDPMVTPGNEFNFWTEIWEQSLMYYDWAGRLRVVDQRKQLYQFNPSAGLEQRPWTSTPEEFEPGAVFEEFRYDALGRRIMARSRPDVQCGAPRCREHFDVYVWSGEQLLHEKRTSAPTSGSSGGGYYGWVTYTHGPGIDAPVSVMRWSSETAANPYSVVLHANRKGQFDMGTYANGQRVELNFFDWAGQNGPLYPRWPGIHSGTESLGYWLGSLITNKTDGSGLVYMRNRYYDPSTGQFTQEDPIGLAGGLNLYGYANGDPVNFSDPFGLSAEPNDEAGCIPCLARLAQGLRALLASRTAAAAASSATAAAAAGPRVAQNAPRVVNASRAALQHTFDRHAQHWGITATKNNESLRALQNSLQSHVQNAQVVLEGTYRGTQPALHYFDPQTSRWLAADPSSGRLIAAFRLSAEQAANLVRSGNIQ